MVLTIVHKSTVLLLISGCAPEQVAGHLHVQVALPDAPLERYDRLDGRQAEAVYVQDARLPHTTQVFCGGAFWALVLPKKYINGSMFFKLTCDNIQLSKWHIASKF